MILFRNLTWLLTILVAILFFASPLKAQVVVGEDKEPYGFSLLELISSSGNEGGLRLPQLGKADQEALRDQLLQYQNEVDPDDKSTRGLVIFNTFTKCVEYWNGSEWVSLCAGSCDGPVISGIISGATSVLAGESVLFYSVADMPGVTYEWKLPVGWTKISDFGNIIIVTAGSNGGNISVTPNKICDGAEKILPVTVYTLGCCKTPPKITIGSYGKIQNI